MSGGKKLDESRDWDAELAEIARNELNEPGSEERDKIVEKMRKWILASNEFKGRTDEGFIVQFLRVGKYDLDKTKKRIRRFYKVKHQERKWFERTPESDEFNTDLIKKGVVYYMNFHGNCSANVYMLKAGCIDFSKVSVETVAASIAQISEPLFEDPRSQVFGYHISLCTKDVGMDAIAQTTPWFMWRMLRCWQKAMPIRIKGLHAVNITPIVHGIVTQVKAILPKKMKDRLFIHKANTNSYAELITAQCLPDEFGGSAGSTREYSDSLIDSYNSANELHRQFNNFGWIQSQATEYD